MSPPSSGLKNKPCKKVSGKLALLATCFHAVFLLGLFFSPEDGGDVSLRNVSGLSTYYTALYQIGRAHV
jgi:hypothetical protein